MVRLNTNFAAAVLASALAIGGAPMHAQSTTPGPVSSPATSGEPMHWRVDSKHGVQPATPSGQPIAPATAPQAAAPAMRTTPYQQTRPAPATQTAPPTARMTAVPQHSTVPPHRHSRKPEVAETPAPPPTPPTPEQLPPNPPEVRYQNGELTINAQNSTMSQVLRAVGSQTGASVDLPASAGNERVVAKLGPGLPGDVLNTLLNGSRFDYVILGVAGNPGAVQKVILTMRQTAAPASSATAQNYPTQPAEAESQDEGAVAETEPEYQNQNPEPRPLPGGFRRPLIPAQPPEQQQQSFSGEQQQNEGKTPEQLMQELQQIQQQQQQYQEQLNPANRQPIQ